MFKTYKHINIDNIPDEMAEELYAIYMIYSDEPTSRGYWCDLDVENPILQKLAQYLIEQGVEEGERIYIDF